MESTTCGGGGIVEFDDHFFVQNIFSFLMWMTQNSTKTMSAKNDVEYKFQKKIVGKIYVSLIQKL